MGALLTFLDEKLCLPAFFSKRHTNTDIGIHFITYSNRKLATKLAFV